MKRLAKGNEAVVMGALLAGCRSYYGYPITPASEISHTAAKLFPQLGCVFLQAESEVAAINMVYGASAAGERTMTASSSPGMSLKMEGISYLAATDLPCVIVDIMRAGPGLGNIGPEQSDYNQIVKGGGHGNYRLIVLAPNSVQEMCDFAIKAFDLADKYRIPVIILADGVIGQMMEPLELPEPVTKFSDKPWAVAGSKEYRKNCHTSIFLDFEELEGRNLALLKKYEEIESAEQEFEGYMLDDAEIVLIAYGVSSRESRTVVDKLRKQGIKAGLFRPVTLWPFPKIGLKSLADKVKKLFVVEMSMGMLIDDVKLTIYDGRDIGFYASYGGKLPDTNELIDSIKKYWEK
ncbi:MAG: 3-methyl-2-oxobutanoate dehydrogenase subunit VorB [Spirochaetes bacterium]|nr:3-methyl-2-oxobutanoate dehydrogenase subunit VorB [Spirochaetota bacterium]